MNWPALLLLVAAVVIFVCVHLGVQRKWATIALGLALAFAALGVDAVFVGLHKVTIH